MSQPIPRFGAASLLAVATMSGCAGSEHRVPTTASPAPHGRWAEPLVLSDRRLVPFLGTWAVAAAFPSPDGSPPATLDGSARVVPGPDGRTIREELTLDGFFAQTVLGYSPTRGRYELTQIDTSTGGQLWLVGRWSADGRTLELAPVDDTQLTGLGFAAMRWAYAFEDGRLLKVIRVRDANGLWRTQSEYVYSRAGG